MKAIIAVAGSILTGAFFMLRDGVPWKDLSSDHFETLDKAQLTRHLIRRLTDLGSSVEVRPAA